MRGKRELPQKRPPILLFVLIFAAGFLAGTLFWHFYPSDASVPSGGTVTLPEDPAETDVSSEPEIPPAPPQDEEPSAEPTPFVISLCVYIGLLGISEAPPPVCPNESAAGTM